MAEIFLANEGCAGVCLVITQLLETHKSAGESQYQKKCSFGIMLPWVAQNMQITTAFGAA